jgi:ureidoglycolate lyase
MRLLRFGQMGAEKPGLLDAEDRIRDLSGEIDDITPKVLAPDSLERLAGLDPSKLPLASGSPRLGCPLAYVPNFLCIGLNYADHARETNSPIPGEPIVFMKHTSSIIGPNDQVRLPRGSVKGDWEVELGVVIGTRAAYVEEADALDYVAGYCIVNDVSERDYQFRDPGKQWIKGKSPETFGPIGPWLVTKDEIPDPQNLAMWLDVDDRRFQDGSSRTMIFGVAHLVSHLSHHMTLLPGDVISTGTPPGVGVGVKPTPVFLKPGNVMRVGIEGLGEQRQEVAAAE